MTHTTLVDVQSETTNDYWQHYIKTWRATR